MLNYEATKTLLAESPIHMSVTHAHAELAIVAIMAFRQL